RGDEGAAGVDDGFSSPGRGRGVITAGRVGVGRPALPGGGGALFGHPRHPRHGAPLLLVGWVAFFYLGMVARGRVRDASRPEGGGGAPDEVSEAEAHVAPTIWPFGFSIAAVMLALGLVVSRWLLVVGGAVFVLAAVGWFRDVARQHHHAHGPWASGPPGSAPDQQHDGQH